jgi:mannose-6-phosphate isomerase-like protein (cupin superfamily)
MSLTMGELQRFVHRLVDSPELWRPHVRVDRAERAYALIWEDESVNAWVICWSEDQDTGYHDHDHSAAAIAVIEGHVLEERLCVGGASQGAIHGPGATVTLPATAIHRVLHAGEGPAVSIHAYSPPLTRTGAYRVTDDGRLEREALGVESELRAQAVGALT